MMKVTDIVILWELELIVSYINKKNMIYNGNIKELDRYHELIFIPELKLANDDFLSKDDLKEYIESDYFLIYKKRTL